MQLNDYKFCHKLFLTTEIYVLVRYCKLCCLLGVAGDAVIQIFLLLLQLAIAPLNYYINKQKYNLIILLVTLLLIFFSRSCHRFLMSPLYSCSLISLLINASALDFLHQNSDVSRLIVYNKECYYSNPTVDIIQSVPLATEPGISLIILPLMRILQQNLKRTYLIV